MPMAISELVTPRPPPGTDAPCWPAGAAPRPPRPRDDPVVVGADIVADGRAGATAAPEVFCACPPVGAAGVRSPVAAAGSAAVAGAGPARVTPPSSAGCCPPAGNGTVDPQAVATSAATVMARKRRRGLMSQVR